MAASPSQRLELSPYRRSFSRGLKRFSLVVGVVIVRQLMANVGAITIAVLTRICRLHILARRSRAADPRTSADTRLYIPPRAGIRESRRRHVAIRLAPRTLGEGRDGACVR